MGGAPRWGQDQAGDSSGGSRRWCLGCGWWRLRCRQQEVGPGDGGRAGTRDGVRAQQGRQGLEGCLWPGRPRLQQQGTGSEAQEILGAQRSSRAPCVGRSLQAAPSTCGSKLAGGEGHEDRAGWGAVAWESNEALSCVPWTWPSRRHWKRGCGHWAAGMAPGVGVVRKGLSSAGLRSFSQVEVVRV